MDSRYPVHLQNSRRRAKKSVISQAISQATPKKKGYGKSKAQRRSKKARHSPLKGKRNNDSSVSRAPPMNRFIALGWTNSKVNKWKAQQKELKKERKKEEKKRKKKKKYIEPDDSSDDPDKSDSDDSDSTNNHNTKSNALPSARNFYRHPLTPFQRHFYDPTPGARKLSAGRILSWVQKNQITIHRGYSENFKDSKSLFLKIPNFPLPVFDFEHIQWPNTDRITRTLQREFDKPTPIQSVTWPLLLSGLNVIGIAKTGSGKTLAFLLPAIVHMRAQPRCKQPKVLIVLPTRELAVQVEKEINKFANDVSHVCVYGGAKEKRQIERIKNGVEIVVATPGRLVDYIQRRKINMIKITFVVWDEADRLLDMGFVEELDKIMENIRPDKQMVMFSATWPKSVRECAAKHLLQNGKDDNVVQVAVGSMDRLNANEDIEQRFLFMQKDSDKDIHLFNFLKHPANQKKKILIFCDRKRRCGIWEQYCNDRGLKALSISGNKQQKQREKALFQFKKGNRKIMFATDLAGRGIHIDDIDIVINYYMPRESFADYIHRIGRTGRAGRKGVAISYFVPEWDSWCAKDLVKVLTKSKQKVPDKLVGMKSTKKKRSIGFLDQSVQISKKAANLHNEAKAK